MKHTTLCLVFALCVGSAVANGTHTVTFRRLNGTVLLQTNALHGANATAMAPALPAETDFTAQGWDCIDKLACVTNDVTCWALYEASTAMSPSTSIASQSVIDRATPYSLEEYFQIYDNLAWSDEFSGSSLSVGSGKNWNYDTEQRNNELQRYTSGGNHIVSDGTLKLECRRESSYGKSFTSGSIKSNGKVQFKYGRCEIRAKLTKQQGTWPAFWTMGTGSWPACGELDVFEQINGSEWIGGNFHLPKGSATISNSGLVCPEDGTHWGDAFHRIGFIFNEFEAVWYVDDHIFKRMDIRNTSRYSMMHDRYRYILLNLAFGGNWPGQTDPNDSSIANFTSEAFEIDYCRIFTNTTAGNTVAREPEPDGARLSGPVNATVWRGWQMRWAKSGAYRSGLDRSEAAFCKAAMTEYFTRDNADIVTFLTRPAENTGSTDLTMPFNIPGVTSLFLSPEQGSNNNSWDGDTREKLLSGVLFNKNRFSQSRSAISSLPLTNDANYTNCCAVVAELVEKDNGAKVKVVSVNVSQTNGIDYATLFGKLNQFKDERTILLFQSMDWSYHTPLRNQATASLDTAYQYLGEYKVWPAYQFAYATTNCVSASAANPEPLSVLKANGQPSGVHTNQSFCATVQFEAEPEVVIEYGQLDQSAFAKKMTVSFTGYSGTALTDFPVLVKLSTDIDGFSYGDFTLTNGGDLRFADASGNLLAHEIDTWNESGVSTVWVKVPSLSSAATIKAYWGCTGTPQAVDSKDVWDENYVGVWHLGESALPMKESSGISTDFSASNNATETLGANGAIGGAVDFSAGNTNARLSANDDDDLDGFTDCTFEFWTKQAAEPSANAFLLTKRMKNAEDVAYVLYGNKDTGKGIFGVSTTGGAPTSIIGSSQNMLPTWGEWCHQAFVRNASGTQKAYGYMNGEARGSSSFTNTAPIHASASKLHLGNAQSGGNAYNGMIDEVRISKVARSAAWIKATHDTVTMTNFATYAVGGAQPAEPDRILYVNVAAGMTDTLNAALVTAYITNIVKTGAGTLAASAIPDYAGAFDIQGGVFQVSNAGDCGAAGAVINVRDGASLEYLGGAANVLSGKTVNLYGAKASSAAAKVVFSNTENRNIGSSVSVNLKDSDEVFYIARGKNINWTSGTIDLGGHELRLKATSSSTRYEIGATFTNGGSVVYEKCLMFAETYAPILGQAGASGATLRLENAAFNMKKALNHNGWNIVCSNSYMTGNIVKFPSNTGVPNWDGDVQFLSASSVANYKGGYNVSNTVFNLKGAVSGSGTLSVGPGWLNLHNANNSYSGAVTVSGQHLTSSNPVLPGGGGIGLWNGATCFTNASSITFNDSARLAFMDGTVCTVPNVTFAGGAGDVQSVSGGVYTARSTMVGFTKTGAGTLVFDSPVSVTGTGNVQAGTLQVANRVAVGSTVEEMVAPQPVFSTLAFASGTTLDLSGNYGFKVANLVGSPVVTNAGVFGVMGSWTLSSTDDVLTVTGENVVLGDDDISGMLAFASGATFTLADEAAFSNAVAAAGADGLVVARARWMLGESNLLGMQLALPTPAAGISDRWSLSVGDGGTTLRLKLAPASGYAAWVAENGISGGPADKTGAIENAVRYAFDIDPQTDEIGDPPILQVVMDGNDNPAVRSRDLAEGRDDVTFGILATEDLGDWSNAALVPMEKSETDGLWRPAASDTPGYVYPDRMFFKYTIEVP